MNNETGRQKTKREATPHSSPLYSHLAPAYHAVWPAMAKRRISGIIKSLDISSGTRLLEVGVGTGMSLDSYPADISITGVDLSESMLSEAKQSIAQNDWKHIEVLPMNAEDLTFPDASFDMVTSFHTISVVSQPQKMMREIVRVCKPGGRVLLINHFRSENPLIAKVVDRAGSLTKRLGWRTDLEVGQVLEDLPLRLDRRYKTNPFSLFTVMETTCKP